MSFTRRPGSGRPRQTSRREDRHILRNARVQPTTSSATSRHSDESRFNLSSDENHVRVWKSRGERLNPTFALHRHTAPTAGVMIWGTIAYNTQSPLVFIRGTMTAWRYVHDILQPHVLPLTQWLPGAIFQKTMLGLTRKRCHKTVSALLLSFFDLPDPQICLQSSIFGNIWDGKLGILRV
ncbi:transposable element Tcb2 transposase [Trichonephila clavipes]|nr:transposable element Tcb2 transposase [Trichonephila clavipes]